MTFVYSFFLKCLHLLPAETAHHVGMWALKCRQFFLRPKVYPPAVHVRSGSRLRVRNRLGLAAGFDKNAEVFPMMAQLGFGFVEVGTVTLKPQSGNVQPRLFRVREHKSLINRMGFNNVGLDQFRQNLQRLRPKAMEFPLLINLGKGKDSDDALRDYQKLLSELEPLGDGFVINISSPNTVGLRDLQSEIFLERVAKFLPPEKPVFVKLAPDLSNESLKGLCQFVASSPFAGIILGNTSVYWARVHALAGGLSGNLLFDRTLEMVAIAREIIQEEKMIVGVGGVDSVHKATQLRKAGADLIEIYTAFIYEGPKLVKNLSLSLQS